LGLFREAERIEGVWRYVGPKRHFIFGWLQVDTVIGLGTDGSHILSTYPWLAQHPHVRPGWRDNNATYLARTVLSFADALPGYGVFDQPVMLTAEDAARLSTWGVPTWLDPTSGGTGMTYHPPNRWLGSGRLTAAARGQEFVADISQRGDATSWLMSLFKV
jgi:hypothetical protein